MGFGAEACGLEKAGWILVKSIAFILASFVFSLIFWLTKKWVDRQEQGKKKKK
jgi:hypothetical protein